VLLAGCAVAGSALADTVVVNDQVQVRNSQVERPKRGLTMTEVEKHFGAPVTRHPTVGGGSPHQPPITRWDYNGFSVFFERDRVVDSVVTGGGAPAEAPAAAPAPAPSA
jgi:hypothetical protein